MHNIIKLLGIVILLIFSFYYINETNKFLVSNSELLKEIESNSTNYGTSYVNAVIYDEYIIPGVNGSEVNIENSYASMSPYNTFSEYFLVYNEITPEISLYDNLDKYIEKGNPSKRVISLVIDKNKDVLNYINNQNVIVNKTSAYTVKNESSLCILTNYNELACKENNYILVKVNTYITNENFVEIKNSIYSGEILYIDNDLTVENFYAVYIEILFRGYELVSLENLVKE